MGAVMEHSSLLRVSNLKKYFPIREGFLLHVKDSVRAVDDVSFDVGCGATLGLAGESGCGKTTVGRCILRLLEATSGEVAFGDSPNLLSLSPKQMKPYRKHLQMIFQNPFASLNPRMTVGTTVAEPLKIFSLVSGSKARRDRVRELLEQVGLREEHMDQFPHQFSGGQRQRIAIARALSMQPQLIICDEAVSALDVSIQAQILNLLKDLQQRLGLSYLFISHNLGVVQYMSDRVAIMYLGKIVEMAPRERIYANPQHPYTQTLMAAIPVPDPTVRRNRQKANDEVPSSFSHPSGCRFHPRCPKAMPICSEQEPPLLEQGDTQVACHLYTRPMV